MPGPGTMTCIDHGKKVSGNPGSAGDPLDLAPLAHALGGMAAALDKIGATLVQVDEGIRLLKLAVHVEPPVVNVAAPRVDVQAPSVTVEPRIDVMVEKQDPTIVNVHVPEGKPPEVVVNSSVEPTPIEFCPVEPTGKMEARDWLYLVIPSTLLICDIVARIIHL